MNKLNKLIHYSLSDADIRNVFKPKKVNIVEYPTLSEIRHIDDLFKNSNVNFCVIFIPENLAGNQGHWTLIIKHLNGDYEYFDSYKNYGPDSEQKWLSKKLLKALKVNGPELTDLFLRSGVNEVVINHYPFQAMKPGVNTCGDQVCARAIYRHLSLDNYWKLIKQSGKSSDDFVAELTYKIIGK